MKKFGNDSYVNHPKYGIGKCVGKVFNGAYWRIEFEDGEAIDFIPEKIERYAARMISFVRDGKEHYWDGSRFAPYRVLFGDEINDELNRAAAALKVKHPIVGSNPHLFEFGIK